MHRALPRDSISGLAVGRFTEAKEDEADQLADKLVAILCSQLPTPATAKARRALPKCPTKLEAKLSGRAEVPAGAPTGKGAVDVTITERKICWDFTVSGIGKPLAAHIHKAPAGRAGPVVVPSARPTGSRAARLRPRP